MTNKKPYIVFYGVWDEMQEYIKQRLKDLRYCLITEKLDKKTLDKNTEILATFVESPITKEIIDSLPQLKMIAAMSTGYDHIDLVTAQSKNITVSNVPNYGEVTVAEHTFALLLALTRKLFPSIKRVKEGSYDFHGLRGIDLQSKILGVIGTGKIGVQVIKRAKAFEMKVLAYDPFPNKQAQREFDFTYTTLDKLLTSADIITLHTPLLPSTHHLINKNNIKKIKSGSFLLNTARGALVDPEALVWALKNNQLAGAGLDVLEDENLIQDEEKIICGKCSTNQLKINLMNKIIIDHPNVIITPHNAFNSVEALQRIVDTTINNIKAFCKGEIQNKVK